MSSARCLSSFESEKEGPSGENNKGLNTMAAWPSLSPHGRALNFSQVTSDS